MPRTFLVKKFKRQDVSSALRIKEPVNGEEKTKLESNESNLLPSLKESCMLHRDSEVKGHLKRKENLEGLSIGNGRSKTAIFMPISKGRQREEQSEVQEVKRAKFGSSFEEVAMGNENGENYVMKQRTEITNEYNRQLLYESRYSIMNAKIESDEDNRKSTSVALNDSTANCEYRNRREETVKRPVALLPEKCAWKECHIPNNFYFRKCKVPRPDMKMNCVLDERHKQDMRVNFNFTQEEEAPYYTLVRERPHKKGDIEQKTALTPLSTYSSRKHTRRPFFTLKCEEKDERTSVPDVVQRMVRPHNMFHFHQMVNHIRLCGNELIADNITDRYNGEHETLEKHCGCRECPTANGNISETCDNGMGEWLKNNLDHCEKRKQKTWKAEVRGEEKYLQKEISCPWMIAADAKTEVKSCEEGCESSIEKCGSSKKCDKLLPTGEENRFLVTKRDGKSDMKRKLESSVNGHQKNVKSNGELTAKMGMTKANSKNIMEVELECHVKSPEQCSLEGFEYRGKNYLKIVDKDRKESFKQQREKDSGKKSRALANWLERKRVAELNDAFERLRRMVPTYGNEDRSLSKIKTLRYATTYIRHLALIHEKQCIYEIEDLKKGLKKVLEIDPMLQRCQEHLESNCII